MTGHKLAVFITMSLILLVYHTDFGNTIPVEANVPFRIDLTSTIIYSNPVTGVDLTCRFYYGDSLRYTCNGYWNGGAEYCVKFSLPDSGVWKYIISSSDPANTGLNNISDTIVVRKNESTNPLYSKGFIQISSDGRHLQYADGTPFFYLGDTAWEITWKSRAAELSTFIENRRSKKFTAIQVVALTHQDINFAQNGVVNREGEPSYLNYDFTLPNPRYFNYLDSIVTLANKNGMIVSLVPLWAAMMKLYTPPFNYRQLTVSQSLLLAKYLAARYAAYNMIWIIGGDNAYDTEKRQTFWNDFATTLKIASGNRQLFTCHPMGSRGSFDFFSNSTRWLDFNMYQSSHLASGDYTWQLGTQGFNCSPAKPVLDGEACYEDIYDNLWAPGDTTSVQTSRIRDIDVRQASYEAVLAGSLVGITYGANGIWQWNTAELPGTHSPRYTALEALDLPASFQMTVLKDLMLKYRWYELKPSPQLLLKFTSSDNHCQVASSDSLMMAYIPAGTTRISFNLLPFVDSLFCTWINPKNGTVVMEKYLKHLFDVSIPKTDSDCVFIARYIFSKNKGALGSSLLLFQNYPNPFNARSIIKYTVPRPAHITLTLYNVVGQLLRTVVDEDKSAGNYLAEIEFPGASGVYFYKFESDGFSNVKKCIFLK